MGRLLLIFLAFTGGSALAAAPEGGWQTGGLPDHALVGHIWGQAEARFVEPETVVSEALQAEFVLLGEKHDNPDHHLLQAEILSSMLDAGRRPAVVMEMIERDRQPDVIAFWDADESDVSQFGEAVAWEKSGWPEFEMYLPVVNLAFEHRIPLIAGDLPQEQRRTVGAQGLDAFTVRERKTLGLDRQLSTGASSSLIEELKRSHCNMLPEKALVTMAAVQRARDATMALAMLEGFLDTGDGAVFIGGAGHAREDRGIPWYLRARVTFGPRIVTIAFREVEEGETDPLAYLPRRSNNDLSPFDYIWFTPRVDNKDPCAEFLKKHKGLTGEE